METLNRKKLVLGNWKMNGSRTQVSVLLNELKQGLGENNACVVIPPALFLSDVVSQTNGTNIECGAQNVHSKESGAYTGEISASMLAEFGCRYVLVGHSERRQLFGESEKFIAEKFHRVKEHDMIPVLCVGETLADRELGTTEQVIGDQLKAVIDAADSQAFENCIVAYEPVWAIGTGKTATPELAQATHAFIRRFVSEYDFKSSSVLPIVYGGSVNAQNAQGLFSMPDIDGGLVGGASLDARQFVEIVKCIKSF